MRVAVLGVGAVGARAARQLASTDDVTAVLVADPHPGRADAVAASLGPVSAAVEPTVDAVLEEGCDAVVLAGPGGTHAAVARAILGSGIHVVSTSDAMTTSRRCSTSTTRPPSAIGSWCPAPGSHPG